MKKGKEKTGIKSIKGKLLKTSISIIAISLAVVGTVASYMNYESTVSSLEQTMVEAVELASKTVTNEMKGYKRIAVEFSNNPVFQSDTSTKEELMAECEKLAKRNGLISVGIGDANGMDRTLGVSLTDREYYVALKNGETNYISDPIVRKDTGEMNIIVAAPIKKNDVFSGFVYLAIDASVLCNIVNDIQIGESGNASIISGEGDTIGYSDVQLVLDAYNTQEDLKNDPQLEQLAAVERRLMAGETGFDTYKYGGVSKYAAFTPISGSNGWGIYVAVLQSEFLQSTYIGIVIVIVSLIVAIIVGAMLMISSAKSIVEPIRVCMDRIKLLAEGDIHSPIPEITTGDETQILAESMKNLIDTLKIVIGDIDYCLGEMAERNFQFESQENQSYIGDFTNILTSINQLKTTLSGALKQIAETSDQVSLGADQMSQNATSLAEGATEQASAVEELTATIAEVADSAKTTASMAEASYKSVNEAARKAEENSREMEELTAAMESISNTSKDIEEIINTIEDIASQTNLLSLNASIEAARAGEAGKGFAVVAEQIGKLASDSGQSAVATKQLIEKSMREISSGNDITQKAATAFNTMIAEMHQFAETAKESNQAAVSQAKTLVEVEQGIEQISQVIQSNSAAAEETSATSQELSAQSENMNSLVSRFKC